MTKRTIVLLGLGHTNAEIVRIWRRRAIEETRLVGISNQPIATYSGMLPGALAGQYRAEQAQIDLRRLCRSAGAELIVGEVVGLDVEAGRLLFKNLPSVTFDVMSVGVGSVPRRPKVENSPETLLPLKPTQTFLDRLEKRLSNLTATVGARPLRIAIIGGGAGGVEIALCLQLRLSQRLADSPVELTLIEAGGQLLNNEPNRVGSHLTDLLNERGVRLLLGRRVVKVARGMLELEDGESLPTDLALWATGAVAPPLLSAFELPKDDRGFLLTDSTLKTLGGAPIFAVGDAGSIQGAAVAKAGVYAVRQAPLLWANLKNQLNQRPLKPFHPQRNFLKLFNTGDGKALMVYRGAMVHARWCWKLKDAIDRSFVAKYQI